MSKLSTRYAANSASHSNALIRLVGAVLAEQHDEWAESRRYLGLDVLSKSRAVNPVPSTTRQNRRPPRRH